MVLLAEGLLHAARVFLGAPLRPFGRWPLVVPARAGHWSGDDVRRHHGRARNGCEGPCARSAAAAAAAAAHAQFDRLRLSEPPGKGSRHGHTHGRLVGRLDEVRLTHVDGTPKNAPVDAAHGPYTVPAVPAVARGASAASARVALRDDDLRHPLMAQLDAHRDRVTAGVDRSGREGHDPQVARASSQLEWELFVHPERRDEARARWLGRPKTVGHQGHERRRRGRVAPVAPSGRRCCVREVHAMRGARLQLALIEARAAARV